MKLSEIGIGERYAVTLGHGQDADQTVRYLGLDSGDLPATEGQRYHEALALDVGVPYKKGRHGVRIEYAYTQRQYDQALEGFLETAQTNRATIHFTALVCPWSEVEVYQFTEQVELHERREGWRAEREQGWPSHKIQEPLTRAERSKLERQLREFEGFRVALTEAIGIASRALERGTLSRDEDLRISEIRSNFRLVDLQEQARTRQERNQQAVDDELRRMLGGGP